MSAVEKRGNHFCPATRGEPAGFTLSFAVFPTLSGLSPAGFRVSENKIYGCQAT